MRGLSKVVPYFACMAHPPPPPGRSGRRILKQLESPPSWRERLRAIRHLPRLIALVWDTHRGYSVAMVLLRALRAVQR